MDMSDDYVAGWRRRLSVDKARRNIRAQEAASAAQKCAHLLYENYGVRKVYLFGSLNKPETFHDKSDIDLVVLAFLLTSTSRQWLSFGDYCPQGWN